MDSAQIAFALFVIEPVERRCILATMKGIALKVTYNDGGADNSLFGFNGTCSNTTIYENVAVRKMTNCSAEGKPCRDFVERGLKGRRPLETYCYERHLFAKKRLKFGCGMYHNGQKAGTAIPVSGINAGDIAFLTTVLPGTRGDERIVFGCFRIAHEPRIRDNWGYMIESDGTMDVRIPESVARQMSFWRFYENKDDSTKWASGLFRKLDEDQTVALLGDLLARLGDAPERDKLLTNLGGKIEIRPAGKLGFGGGESDAHRTLKEFVANNPEKVGLPADAQATLEFPYRSGDQVDVKFDLPDGSAAIVEIETIDAWTGAHQCIKYRALLEAERGEALGCGNVEAILVAHFFDRKTLEFAAKYEIRTVELRPPPPRRRLKR